MSQPNLLQLKMAQELGVSIQGLGGIQATEKLAQVFSQRTLDEARNKGIVPGVRVHYHVGSDQRFGTVIELKRSRQLFGRRVVSVLWEPDPKMGRPRRYRTLVAPDMIKPINAQTLEELSEVKK